jgi:nucleoside-diphosphate kinase
MSTNRTFTIIKPDAVSDGFTGPIIQQIEEAGFKIIAMKKVHLSAEEAGKFYAVHQSRPFYGELCDFISSNAIIPMVLEKDNAVEDFRKLIGSTDPANAEEGTIRKRFARSLASNAIHGSDSDENAAIEGSFFFSPTELR